MVTVPTLRAQEDDTMLLAQTGLLLPRASDALWNITAILVWIGLGATLLVAAFVINRVRHERAAQEQRSSKRYQ